MNCGICGAPGVWRVAGRVKSLVLRRSLDVSVATSCGEHVNVVSEILMVACSVVDRDVEICVGPR